MKNVEQQFEELAERTSQEAAGINCSPEEYRDGLLTIIEVLKADRLANAEMHRNPDEDF